MAENISISNLPKTATFQMRINPEIKSRVEAVYAQCGMTLTDAINVFIQQSLNIGGLPLLVTQNSKEIFKEQALAFLVSELKKGEDSVKSEEDWISEDDVIAEFAGDV